jgi:hypothetical protein
MTLNINLREISVNVQFAVYKCKLKFYFTSLVNFKLKMHKTCFFPFKYPDKFFSLFYFFLQLITTISIITAINIIISGIKN